MLTPRSTSRFVRLAFLDLVETEIHWRGALITSKRPQRARIFCEGYGGDIVIMSGDALLYLNQDNKDFYELDVPWQESFIGIQFKLSVIDALAYLT